MKRTEKDPFKNTAYPIFIYNLGERRDSESRLTREERMQQYGLHPYNQDVLDTLPATNFEEKFEAHFGKVDKHSNHVMVVREHYKLYYYDEGVEANFTHLTIAGKQAILELLELGRIHNWAVICPGGRDGGFVDLSSLPSYGYQSLEAYYGDE